PWARSWQSRAPCLPNGRPWLEALVREHLRLHHNDPEKSLAALGHPGTALEELTRSADADVQASLAHLGPKPPDGAHPRAAGATTVGQPTLAGQRFRIVRPHAKGGLGQVSVALDGELHREVALKEIQDRYADDPYRRQRFLLEAEITGGLEHPGVVPVYGLGTYGDGRPYYAMRFIRGESLKEAIERFHSSAARKSDPGRRSFALRPLLPRFLP